jgi:hypothetical protein
MVLPVRFTVTNEKGFGTNAAKVFLAGSRFLSSTEGTYSGCPVCRTPSAFCSRCRAGHIVSGELQASVELLIRIAHCPDHLGLQPLVRSNGAYTWANIPFPSTVHVGSPGNFLGTGSLIQMDRKIPIPESAPLLRPCNSVVRGWHRKESVREIVGVCVYPHDRSFRIDT